MNTRDYKQCAEGEYYHIYNRGNDKNGIFLNSEDYSFFLHRLKQNLFPEGVKDDIRIQLLPPKSFSLIGYCLMPNHFHLLIRQNKNISTSKLLSKVSTSYSKFFNKKYNKVGHVFQDRFKQIPIDSNDYLKWLSCYIHQNPKVAGLVKNLEDYDWSSYGYYVKGQGILSCDSDIILEQFIDRNDYAKFVETSYKVIKDRKDIEHLLLD